MRRSTCLNIYFFLDAIYILTLCIQCRSGGERGADVDTLRGTHGPNFEGYALVVRGPSTEIDCGCFGGSKRRKEQLLLIKGPFIFVFDSEKDKAPKYAINLVHLSARYNGTFGGDHVVLLETSLRDVEYEFNFEKKEIAKSFIEAVTEQAQNGETNEIIKVSDIFFVHWH